MAKDRAQVLGYLGSSVEHEGGGVRGSGVDDAQLGILGVETEHEVPIAALDAEAQGLEVQTLSGPPLRHAMHLLSCLFGMALLARRNPRRGELAPC
jgi:hypothetical protein